MKVFIDEIKIFGGRIIKLVFFNQEQKYIFIN